MTVIPSALLRTTVARAMALSGVSATGFRGTLSVSQLSGFFVDGATGNNGNAGTIGSPWATIKWGIEHMSAGDTLYIRGGTYAESLSVAAGVNFPSGSSWANAPVISAYPSETVTVRPSSGEIVGITGSRSYVIFQDLIFDGVNLTGVNDLISIGSGGANHVRFIDCEGKNNADGQIVAVSPEGSFVEWIGGSIHGSRENEATSPRGGYGVYCAGKDCLFDGVTVYDVTAYGFHIYVSVSDHPGASVDRNVVKNCLIYEVFTAPTYASTTGILFGGDGTGNVAFNNIIRGIKYGMTVTVDNTFVYHNTFVHLTDVAIDTNSAANTLDVRNNIFAHTNGVNTSPASGRTQTNNLFFSSTSGSTGSDSTGDPVFVNDVNTTSGNFHLQSGSPARNIGANLVSTVPTDKDGVPRVDPPDVGAYEFV